MREVIIMNEIPNKQYAVQLVGPGQLKVNPQKDVFTPGEHQILAKVDPKPAAS